MLFRTNKNPRGSAWTAMLASTLSLVACTGQLDFDTTAEDPAPVGSTPESQLPGDPGVPGMKPPLLEQGACADATPARLWRLSHSQYENSISELLGAAQGVAANFEPETSGTGFRNGAASSFVSPRLAEDYSSAAAKLAADAVQRIDEFVDCDPSDEGCASAFIDEFGHRAFRRELDEEQQALYQSLYELAPGPAGLGIVIETILQSPYFLYRLELGEAGEWGERVRLTPSELATQLSFLLWNQGPDRALLDAVRSGAFTSDEAMLAELDTMLEDPRAQQFFWNFLEQHFEFDIVRSVDKSEELYPSFTTETKTALVEEARAFSNDVIWNQSGTVDELLTSNTAYLNEQLADFYGVDAPGGSRFELVELDREMRVGLLTHGGFLSVLGHAESGSPTLRGNFVRTQLLCQQIPEPPDDVDDSIDPPGETNTTRERYQEHLVNDSCKGCHTLTDPIGFGFENFDAVGRYRTAENGQPIDATGIVANLSGENVEFDGPRELVEALLSSDDLYDCVGVHFFRYALGRLNESFDECTITELNEAFRSTSGNLPLLLKTLVQSGAFTHRVKQ